VPTTKSPTKYQAGDWFAIPVDGGGYALGLIARAYRGPAILAYAFGPLRPDPPTADDIAAGLTPRDAVIVCRVGYLGLKSGKWPIIAHFTSWNPAEWPMPAFAQVNFLNPAKAFKRRYDEKRLLDLVEEEVISAEEAALLPEDGSFGAEALEIELGRLLRR
jgi:hypothetical protein